MNIDCSSYRTLIHQHSIQKGLACLRVWSGTDYDFGRYGRSEILPRRLYR